MKRYIRSAVVDILDEPKEIQEEIANNSKTSPRILKQLANSEYSNVLSAVAHNPHTPPDVLKHLYEKYYDPTQTYTSNLMRNVISNPNLPDDILTDILKSENTNLQAAIAMNPKTPPEVLEQYARMNDWNVPRMVASNPNTPLDTLKYLTSNPDCLYALVMNPSFPRNLLVKIAGIRQYSDEAMVSLEDTPEDALEKLSHSNLVKVRAAVAKHPNTNRKTILNLLGDPSAAVRKTASKNPKISKNDVAQQVTPQSVLKKFETNEATSQDVDYIINLVDKDTHWCNYIVPMSKDSFPLQIILVSKLHNLTHANADIVMENIHKTLAEHPELVKKLL